MFTIGLGEDGPDDRGDHILGAFRHDRKDVAYEMDPTSLPGRTLEHGPDRFLQPGVSVGHDKLHAIEAARFQRAKERGPETFVLGIADVEAEDFAATVHGHPDGNDDRLGDDAVVDAGFAVRRVEEHVWVVQGRQGPITKLRHISVQASADPRDLRLRDPRIGAECLDEVVDFPRQDAVQIGFHHHGEQRLVDPPAPFEQGGEERAGPQLRDPQIKFPSGRRQHSSSAAVAVGSALIGAFERASADERGRFGVDQLLIERFRRDPDSVGDVGEF